MVEKLDASFTGAATPSPFTTAVLIPMTRPSASASGPPELPGARRTSVRIQLCAPMPVIAPIEWMTPVETAPINPKGLPTAIASWPGRTRQSRLGSRAPDQLRRCAQRREIPARIARRTRAGNTRPSERWTVASV